MKGIGLTWLTFLLLFCFALTTVFSACGDDDDDDDSVDYGDDDDDDDTTDDDDDDDTTDDDDSTDDDDDTTDDDDDTTDDDDDTTDDDDDDVTIYDVRNGAIADGTVVTLDDVVVTSAETTSGSTGFFVQVQPGASAYVYEYSGLFVFNDTGSALSVSVGDLIDVTGEVDTYQNMTQLKVASASDITINKSKAALPDPFEGTADLFGGWDATDAEPYESVLVKVQDVVVDSAQSGNVYWISQTGVKPLADGQVRVDDWFYDLDAAVAEEFDYIIGPLSQHDNDGEGHVNYRIQPRDADDVQVAGGGDDDDDTTGDTIYDIQDGTLGDGDPVTISNVVATTGMRYDGNGFFVQVRPGSGSYVHEYSGVFVFIDLVSHSISVSPEMYLPSPVPWTNIRTTPISLWTTKRTSRSPATARLCPTPM